MVRAKGCSPHIRQSTFSWGTLETLALHGSTSVASEIPEPHGHCRSLGRGSSGPWLQEMFVSPQRTSPGGGRHAS